MVGQPDQHAAADKVAWLQPDGRHTTGDGRGPSGPYRRASDEHGQRHQVHVGDAVIDCGGRRR